MRQSKKEKCAAVHSYRNVHRLSLVALLRKAYMATHEGSVDEEKIRQNIESLTEKNGHPPRYLMHYLREEKRRTPSVREGEIVSFTPRRKEERKLTKRRPGRMMTIGVGVAGTVSFR
jgi:hypothetical protein